MCFTILIFTLLLQHMAHTSLIKAIADQIILHSGLLCNIRNCKYHYFNVINEFDELL